MMHMKNGPARTLVTWLAAFAVLAGACNAVDDTTTDGQAMPVVDSTDQEPPTGDVDAAPQPVAKPATEPAVRPAELVDGSYEARLVHLDTEAVTLDLIEVLSGAAAVEAAKAAGVPLDENGTLPNDVFVKDLGRRVTVPVAGDGGFQIYDCSGGCELVGTTLSALVSGSAKPYGGGSVKPYGGESAPFSVRVDAGIVVSLVEVYLP